MQDKFWQKSKVTHCVLTVIQSKMFFFHIAAVDLMFMREAGVDGCCLGEGGETPAAYDKKQRISLLVT